MPNKYIADITNCRFARICRNYVWSERRLWTRTLAAALLVAVVVCASMPREYEAMVFTFAESTVPEINDTRNLDAMAYGIRRPARDDIIPSYYKLLFRSRPFLMSVLQGRVVKQGAPDDTLTLYDYVTQDLRYPWWVYLRSGVMQAVRWPVELVRDWGAEEETAGSDTADAPDPDRYTASHSRLNQLTRAENVATGVLWKRIEYEVDVKKRGVTFRLRMQDPLVAAIAVDSLRRKVEERVQESRMAKIRQNLAYLEAEAEKAREEYEEAQQTYAAYRDRNQLLNTRRARVEQANLNVNRQLAYATYQRLLTQVNKAKENLVRENPVLTVVQPAEVPRHPVSRWPVVACCLLLAVAGTVGWIFLKRRSFRLRFRLKRPTVRKPRLFSGRIRL